MHCALRLSKAGAGGVCIGLLIVPYLVYRRDALRVSGLLATSTPLRRPLAEFPLVLRGWTGKDIPMEAEVARVAAADDYLNRQYRHIPTGELVAAYLAYYGTPRPRVGHHPEVCYPAFGWQKETQGVEMVGDSGVANGRKWPVSIYRFRKGPDRVTVVSCYIAGGQWTPDRDEVDSLAHGSIEDARRQYFLRVMLSFPGAPPADRVAKTAGRFLSDLSPALDAHLPDPLSDGPGHRQE
ncbi:MAG TPA: EpsI family protein [Planctomycetota bacterium]|nr:EpsI family protein [Planctomycetota bacterium]HRR81541.1 EpsI family protein [Planctomycetota bacterium]HRT94919.1 EpsI family protein [Planctomycetota bacterium]